MNAILRPAHYLTQIVGSGGKAVISSGKIGQSSHLAVLPNEAEVDVADVVGRAVESRTAPALAQRLWRGGLGNTRDDSRGIFHVPSYTAVWSSERAQIEEGTVSPQRRVPVPVRESGISCHPALVINAVSSATRSAE
jgi:hypothetical protein